MSRAHGTRAKYTIEACRCDECRDASRRYERERRNDVVPRLVSAGPARDHVTELMRKGMGYKAVAEAAGVSTSAVSALLYGKLDRPPTRRIKPDTAAALLAVRFDLAGIPDSANVDAATTHANVAKIVAAGIPRMRIAERLGIKVLQLRADAAQVSARTARVIAEMAAELDAGTLVTVRRSRHGDTVIAPPAPELKERPRTFAEAEEIDRFLHEMADIFEDKAQPWRTQAACRGEGRPTWLWFSARGDGVTQDKARQICDSCFVRSECLAYAESRRERVGMWGGVSIRRHRIEHGFTSPCDYCGEDFKGYGAQRLCSDECRRLAHNRSKNLAYHRSKAS